MYTLFFDRLSHTVTVSSLAEARRSAAFYRTAGVTVICYNQAGERVEV